jgi:hypothetical protein
MQALNRIANFPLFLGLATAPLTNRQQLQLTEDTKRKTQDARYKTCSVTIPGHLVILIGPHSRFIAHGRLHDCFGGNTKF